MYEIYLITNTVNGKKYVGQTSTNYKKRWLKHINSAINSPNRGCVALYRAIRKYSKEKFIVELLEITSEANKRELYWIEKLRTQNPKYGYNLTSGGDHFKMSESAKKKLSNKLKGRKITWSKKTSKGMSERWKDTEYRKMMVEKHTGKRGYKYKKHSKPLRLNLDTKEINRLYEQGVSIYKIAKQLNVCWTAIQKRIKK